jgi:hypothetical protein
MPEAPTFYVVGRERRQHGPLTSDLLEEWVLNRQVTLDSLAWTAGESEWQPLIQLLQQRASRKELDGRELTFIAGFSNLLKREGFNVGVPSDGVDTRSGALGAKVGVALTKFAIGALTKQRVYGSVSIKGAVASQAAIHDMAAEVIASTDMFAFRNSFSRGTSATLVISGDSLPVLTLLARLELLKRQCERLREFAVEVNGAKNIVVQTVVTYVTPETFESHRRVLPLAGYQRQLDKIGWTTSFASLVDLRRRIVDYPLMKGFLGGLQRVTGIRPFGSQELASALALADDEHS